MYNTELRRCGPSICLGPGQCINPPHLFPQASNSIHQFTSVQFTVQFVHLQSVCFLSHNHGTACLAGYVGATIVRLCQHTAYLPWTPHLCSSHTLLLSLKYSKCAPTSGPLRLLFSLPEMLFFRHLYDLFPQLLWVSIF